MREFAGVSSFLGVAVRWLNLATDSTKMIAGLEDARLRTKARRVFGPPPQILSAQCS
jgi:hypothetical protein